MNKLLATEITPLYYTLAMNGNPMGYIKRITAGGPWVAKDNNNQIICQYDLYKNKLLKRIAEKFNAKLTVKS